MHYIYTKSGASDFFGYGTTGRINKLIKKAEKLGVKASKVVAGIEYFDIDVLSHPEEFAPQNKEKEKVKLLVERISHENPNIKRVQLSLFDLQ